MSSRIRTRSRIRSEARGTRIHCGKPPPPPRGRMGSSWECFRRGIAISATRKKTPQQIRNSDLVSAIKGIGPQISERLEKKEGIKTIKNLLDRVRQRDQNARTRREFLKRVLRNFRSRRVNRMAFANVRYFLVTKGIEVLDMTVSNK